MTATPAAGFEIDAALVRKLLLEQQPLLSELAITHLDEGWDNQLFRLGDTWVVRLPRREVAARLVAHEQAWLPQLAPTLPLPIPSPVYCGKPSKNYPWPWSVLPWLEGTAADLNEPKAHQALPLACFLSALHVSAPADAPRSAVRGVPLITREAVVAERMQRVRIKTSLITPAIERLWREALAAPIDMPSTWLHGDLHARNVLCREGVISGVIDWGDVCAGDRATDLAAIWMLLADKAARREAIQALTAMSLITEATWARAKGWAVLLGVMLLDTGLVDHPRHAVMGERTLKRLIEDAHG
jgi:aminoglycoside phosphotransferase (APT) family kinase protein